MQLHEDTTAGLHVEVDWRPRTQVVWLIVEMGNQRVETSVPLDKVMDAINHPTCYLSADDKKLLFARQPVHSD